MARCTICAKPAEERVAIEGDLLRNIPLRVLAEKWGLPNHYPLHRHRQHLPERMLQAKQAEEVAEASTLLQRVESLIGDCKGIADRAKKDKNWQAATAALREIRSNLELLGRLSGELQAASMSVRIGVHSTTVNVGTEALSETDLELTIAREVAEATNGFDPREIARLKALIDGPLMLEGTLGDVPNVPSKSLAALDSNE